MEAIRATFFVECDELLADLEAGLLAMQQGEADSETVNSVFRAVHSIKGGAGAFGLDELVRFAHVFETTLDEIRTGRLAPDAEVIALMLRAFDVLTDHVGAAKGGADVDEAAAAAVLTALQHYSGAQDAAPLTGDDDDLGFDFAPAQVLLDDEPAASAPSPRLWTISLRPFAALYRNANDALLLVRELGRLGPTQVAIACDPVEDFEAYDLEEPILTWTIQLTAEVERRQIEDVFEFVEGDCGLEIACDDASEELAAPTLDVELDEPGEDPEALLARLMSEATEQPPAPPASASELDPATPKAEGGPARAPTDALVQTTIRVDLERVDRLIDLVGELVINQSMIAQRVAEVGLTRSSTISLGLDDLEQLTREIQDSVMAIRAQPVKSVFQRMPRLVREVAAATGKQVRLVTDGEGTEVDKTVIERLSDPITHMIRNAIDHGLETPAVRLAAGKPEEGVVRLSAQHRSGRIVIEVSDDGAGIDRKRVLATAISRGLVEPDAALTDDEIDNLIFAPGFSTASALSDISGRGVGMDVVKKSIQMLGGRIFISSDPGRGSTFTLSLPLTLAVLDGMVVSAGDQTLVVPISVIVETLQPKAADVRPLGADGTVLAVRGRMVPLIDVTETFGWPSGAQSAGGVTLLVESGKGGLVALRVDAIQGQRQVVIKSLEQNYRSVQGVAAATILGDGRVALILDVEGLVGRSREAGARALPPLAHAS